MKNGYQLVGDIIKERFIIPKYQRGYRWTGDNVKKLLEDIYEGKLDDLGKGQGDLENKWEKYCIQPLVVSTYSENEGSCVYEVIDGQQRLTTIAIILAALKNTDALKDTVGLEEIHPVDMQYESRETSKAYIQGLYAGEMLEDENIDFAFMKIAYEQAKAYFDGLMKDKENPLEYAKDLYTILCKNNQFIWYWVDTKDPETVFANFNTGKMELTNSELIKALFMDPANYSGANVNDKQIVISEKWDEIENKLHEPNFWAFVPHPKQYETDEEMYATRIDVIFEYLAMEIWLEKNDDGTPDVMEGYQEYRKEHTSDKYIFNEIDSWLTEQLKDTNDNGMMIDQCWRRVNHIYSGLKELYEKDSRMYNLVGLYINIENRNPNSVDSYIEDSEKYLSVYKQLRDVLKLDRDRRESKMKEILRESIFKGRDIKSAITGTMYPKGKAYSIIKILILYNIALLNTPKKTGTRYNFLENAKMDWQREHIFACDLDVTKQDNSEPKEIRQQRESALEVLKGDAYIDYVNYLFDLNNAGEDDDNKASRIYKLLIDKSELSDEKKEEIKQFVKDNPDKSGNGKQEILARAIRAKIMAEELVGVYENIDDVVRIQGIEEKEFKKEAAYQYLKEHETQYANKESMNICDMYKILESDIDKARKEEEYEKTFFQYGEFTGKSSVASDSTWKGIMDKICESYQRKVKEKMSGLKSSKTSRDFWNEDNEVFIMESFEVHKKTLESRIDHFFKEKSDFVKLLIDNSMGNMTLLTGNRKQTEDSGQNQTVSNKPYCEKRNDVYEFFEEGQFVPLGTLLVFTDIYTKAEVSSQFWLPNSRLAYLKNMVTVIEKLLK